MSVTCCERALGSRQWLMHDNIAQAEIALVSYLLTGKKLYWEIGAPPPCPTSDFEIYYYSTRHAVFMDVMQVAS